MAPIRDLLINDVDSESITDFAMSTSINSIRPEESEETDITILFPEISKEELTKLMIQALNDLGYAQSAQSLQTESRLPLESKAMSHFSQLIKDGQYEDAVGMIHQLALRDDDQMSKAEMRNKIQFLIKRMKFLEELFASDENNAVQILRDEVTELATSQDIRNLTTILTSKNTEAYKVKNGWINNSISDSRMHLLDEISTYISPSSMIPKHRLFRLLQHSFAHQRSMNLYHFGNETNISLYEDIKSNKTYFPDTILYTLSEHTDEVWYAQFSHDGTKLVTCSADNSIYIYDTSDFSILKHLEIPNKKVMYASFSPDDTKLLTCSVESKARIWDVESGDLDRSFQLDSDCRLWSGDWYADGTHVVLGSPDKEVVIFNVKTGELADKLSGLTVNDLKVSIDGKLIIGSYDKNIHVYDLTRDTFNKLTSFSVGEKITNITISKNNPSQILVNLSPNELQLWDWTKGVLLTNYIGHKQGKFIIRSCFGYDEQVVASGSEDGRVFLWNREFGALLGVFDGHDGLCNSVTWNDQAEGKSMFVSCGDDHKVKVWGPSGKAVN